jgi:hypothetical protein
MQKKQRVVVWLEPDTVAQLDRYAEKLAKIKDADRETGRKKSRSKAARRAILDGLGWSGMQL